MRACRLQNEHTFISELSNRSPINKMDHLVCFAPGHLCRAALAAGDPHACSAAMLVLGVQEGAVSGAAAEAHMKAAEVRFRRPRHHALTRRAAGRGGCAQELLDTCMQMYTSNPTGLSPEFVSFHSMVG